MAKKNNDGYLSARESRRITRENRKITNVYEKQRKRKNVPESEYLTAMNDPGNSLEIDNLHTYFFSDVGTVHAVDGISFEVPLEKLSVSSENPDAERALQVFRSCSFSSALRGRLPQAKYG